jgi:hypothetical protein
MALNLQLEPFSSLVCVVEATIGMSFGYGVGGVITVGELDGCSTDHA